jgi:hypothetical protein
MAPASRTAAAKEPAATAARSAARRRTLSHGLALLIYSLAALLLTWPLATHMATHVPGDGIDDPALAWNLWWLGERLVQQGSPAIFDVGWMFHPVAINLAFYTLTPLHGLLSIPLQYGLSLTLANNLILLSTFVLGGYGAFLLVGQLLWQAETAGRSKAYGEGEPAAQRGDGAWRAAVWVASLLAGLLYAFAAPKLFYVALGQFNIAGSQWIPFCALYAVRLWQTAGRPAALPAALRAGMMAGLFLVFQAWTELTYASFLILFLALLAPFALVAGLRHRTLQAILMGFVSMGAVFVIGIYPILGAMLPDLRAEGDFFASGGGFADVFSADLAGFLLPTRLHPFAGELAAALPFANDKGQQVFLGYVALLLAVVGFVWLWRRARAQAAFWAMATLFFWLLSLGPSVRWMGRDLGIPAPFALVSLLPFFNGNRYPSRYSVMLLLCVAVLMAAGVMALVAWLARRQVARAPAWAGGAVAALLLLEHLALPLPMSDMRIPPLYTRLAAEPGDLAVLELPTGWRNGARVLGYSDLLIMRQQWYQTEHGKRRLGGNTSRNPTHKFQYFTDHPLVGDLIALMNAEQPHMAPVIADRLPSLIARHRPVAGQELADLGIGWVTLHVEKASPALLRFVDEALPLALVEEWRGTDAEGNASTIRLYRVNNDVEVDANATQRSVDPATDAGAAFLAEGWSRVAEGALREAVRPAAHLLLPLPDRGGQLTIEAVNAPRRVLLNGRPHSAQWDGESLLLTFLAGEAGEAVDRVTLEWDGEGTAADSLALTPSPIGATGSRLPPGATVAVWSAGEEVGDGAEIWINGRDMAAGLPQRGYLLAAMQPTGALLAAEAFDTHANAAESARLAEWIEQWPQGTIVAGAVADEASYSLGEEAAAALRSLGVRTDLRGQFRWSHAFVGVVGAPAGSALEAADLLRPAAVWLGPPVTGERVYGAIGPIHWRGAGQVAQAGPMMVQAAGASARSLAAPWKPAFLSARRAQCYNLHERRPCAHAMAARHPTHVWQQTA